MALLMAGAAKNGKSLEVTVLVPLKAGAAKNCSNIKEVTFLAPLTVRAAKNGKILRNICAECLHLL